MHEKIKLKTYKFTLSPLCHQFQLDIARKVEVLLMCGDPSRSHLPTKKLLVSKIINSICMKISSKGTFLQDSFTHILRNQNAKPTLAIVTKQMFGKRYIHVSFAFVLWS